jgi:hypothetical protein
LKIASHPTAAAPCASSPARASSASTPPFSVAAATSCSPAKTLMIPMTISPAIAPLKNMSQSTANAGRRSVSCHPDSGLETEPAGAGAEGGLRSSIAPVSTPTKQMPAWTRKKSRMPCSR